MSIAPPPQGPDNKTGPSPPNSAGGPLSAATGSAWSLSLGRVAGIPIRLHFTFLLFLVWVGIRGGGGLGIALICTLFACVVLHELGHSLVALRYGIPVADITLYPIGGVARIEKRPTARQELWIALAGPAVNVVIAALLYAVLMGTGKLLPPEVTSAGKGGWRGFIEIVMTLNVSLVLFNLIPAFPMDGGRVLRAALALNMPPERATAIAAGIGQFIAIATGLVAVLHQPPYWYLIFIAFFVYLGAGQEAFAYRQEALLEGITVEQAMMHDVRTLTVGNTLKEAADVLLDTSQHDFPVLHGAEVQGVLTRNGLLRGLSQDGPGAYVAGAMNRTFASATPDEELSLALPRLQGSNGPLVVLGEDKELLGIVTGENVSEFFAVQQIVAARGTNNNGR